MFCGLILLLPSLTGPVSSLSTFSSSVCTLHNNPHPSPWASTMPAAVVWCLLKALTGPGGLLCVLSYRLCDQERWTAQLWPIAPGLRECVWWQGVDCSRFELAVLVLMVCDALGGWRSIREIRMGIKADCRGIYACIVVILIILSHRCSLYNDTHCINTGNTFRL